MSQHNRTTRGKKTDLFVSDIYVDSFDVATPQIKQVLSSEILKSKRLLGMSIFPNLFTGLEKNTKKTQQYHHEYRQ